MDFFFLISPNVGPNLPNTPMQQQPTVDGTLLPQPTAPPQSSSATPSNASCGPAPAHAPAAMLLRPRPFLFRAVAPLPLTRAHVPSRRTLSASAEAGTASPKDAAPAPVPAATRKNARKAVSKPMGIVKTALFLPPGVERDAAVAPEMVIPGSNIVVGPYAGDARVKEAEFVKSSARARDCPKDDRPEFAVLGRSNVGKSSLINALTRRKEAALTSKKPGDTDEQSSSFVLLLP